MIDEYDGFFLAKITTIASLYNLFTSNTCHASLLSSLYLLFLSYNLDYILIFPFQCITKALHNMFNSCPHVLNHSCSKTHVGVASSILGSQLGKKRRDIIKMNTRGRCICSNLSLLEPTM